ncbi:MAG: ribonuclease R [Desulfobacteraceae bacterium 4572_35.1]|nr:MAG: ribonuclease R [Desulfobacteraceae bacterium 4572_35.1]
MPLPIALPIAKIIKKISAFAKSRSSFTAVELAHEVGLVKDQIEALKRFLDILVAAHLLRYGCKHRYRAIGAKLLVVEGVIKVHRSGYAFLAVNDDTGEDLYVSSFHLGSAMDGDTVLALVLPQHQPCFSPSHSRSRPRPTQRSRVGRRREGIIVDIVLRSHKTVCGVCRWHQRSDQLVCRDKVVDAQFVVDGNSLKNESVECEGYKPVTLDGKCVVLAIDRYPHGNILGRGHVIRVLGDVGAPVTDILQTAYRLGIATEFSADVLREAQQVAVAPDGAEVDGRVDLRALPLVTIDGDDAKDFDDAVAFEAREGGWKLWVAIADVSHYVTAGTILDAAAYERGTSVYFPGFCLPMLPESLSNGICSLNPGVDRLVMVAEMDFDKAGKPLAVQMQRGLMCSKARLTYTQVQKCLDGETCVGVEPTIAAMLLQMAEFAQLLHAERVMRGALDFDLPEVDIKLDDSGMPVNVGRRVRTVAHRLIEEFMLAANEAVAQWIEQRSAAMLYRVHEAPDTQAVHAFQQFVAEFSLGFNIDESGINAKQLQLLLQQVQGREHQYIISQVLLRMMQQAHYSADNGGHFGLASDAYCHFTSPIRRYPDLIQHRIVFNLLAGSESYARETLEIIAQRCTASERRAMAAERDVVDLRKCQFMFDRVGLRFSGFISAVTEFGFFVELNEYFVEGLVHIRTLADDFYSYEPEHHRLLGQRQRKIFQVGMAVEVEVVKVNSEHRQIDFVLPSLTKEVRRGRFARRSKYSTGSKDKRGQRRS